MEKIIEALSENGYDGAILFIVKDGRVDSIAPVIKVNTIHEMFSQLSDLREGLDLFLKDLYDKILLQNGQKN